MKAKLSNIMSSVLYRDSTIVFLVNVLASALNIGSTALLVRSISKAEFGTYSLYFTFLAVGGMLILPGLNIAINKAALLGKVEYVKIGIKRSLKWAAVWMIFGLLVAYAYNHFFKLDSGLFYCVCGALLTLPALAFDRTEIVLMGVNHFRRLALYKIFNAVFIFGVALVGHLTNELFYVAFSLPVYRLLVALIGYLLYRQVLIKSKKDCDYSIEKLNKEAGEISLLNIFQNLVTVASDTMMYSIDPTVLAIYRTGSQVTVRIKDYVKLIFNVPLHYWLRKGPEYYNQKIKQFVPLLLCGVIVICSLLSCFAFSYVPYLYGDQYHDAVLVAQLIPFMLLPKIGEFFLAPREIVHADTRFFQKVSYATVVVALIGTFPLVYYFKAAGMVANIIIYSMFSCTAYYIRYRRKA